MLFIWHWISAPHSRLSLGHCWPANLRLSRHFLHIHLCLFGASWFIEFVPLGGCFSLTTKSTLLPLRIHSVWDYSTSTAHATILIKCFREGLRLLEGWFLDNRRDDLRLDNGWQRLLLNFGSFRRCSVCHKDALPWWFLVTSNTHQSLLHSVCNIRIPTIWAVRASH